MTKSEIAALPTIPMSVVNWFGFKTMAGGNPVQVGWVAFVDPKTKAVAGLVATTGKGCKYSMALMSHNALAAGWTAYRIEA